MTTEKLINRYFMRNHVDEDDGYYCKLIDYSITIEHEYKDVVDISFCEVHWNNIIHDIEFGYPEEMTITYKELYEFLYNDRIKKLNSL